MSPKDENPSNNSTSVVESAQGKPEGQKDLLRALLFCIALVVLVRSFIVEPFRIPSSSMLPTLKIGDHIFVSKFNYGLSIPYTKIEFVRWSGPKRGDVIVFLYPRDESLHYIKRVIGVPGDRIQFRGRDIYINGNKLVKKLVTEPQEIEEVTGDPKVALEMYRETISGADHYVQYTRNRKESELFNIGHDIVVPDDRFFVVGDNRDDSSDSRVWGFVPRENIKGKAQFIWLSLNQDESWGRASKVRWERAFKAIH